MYIDDNYNFLYIAVPKTGTASLHSYMGYHTGHPEPEEHHMTAREAIIRYPRVTSYFKFAFVRNPWSKIVSVYHDFIKIRGHQYSAKRRFEKPLLHEFDDFEDFCVNLHNSAWKDNVFFKPQNEFVFLEDNKSIDYVGKFENLTEHFHEVCSMLGYPIRAVPMHHVGKYNHDYRQYFTLESREAIRELYEQDLELFEYEF